MGDVIGEEGSDLMRRAQEICDKLSIDMTVKDGNAIPILLAMCQILTDKVLRLEKRMGNSDGRTIESVGRESAGGTD